MKKTNYYSNTVLTRRPYLREEWLKEAWEAPLYVETQPDGRKRHFIYISEYDKYLRVVFEDDFVHNAFLDRRFKLKAST